MKNNNLSIFKNVFNKNYKPLRNETYTTGRKFQNVYNIQMSE